MGTCTSPIRRSDSVGPTPTPPKELTHDGVYRLTRSGELSRVTKDLPFPNGIAFSPDEKTLDVANGRTFLFTAPSGIVASYTITFDEVHLLAGEYP
jgi:sugar lactone lactonase YvrE